MKSLRGSSNGPDPGWRLALRSRPWARWLAGLVAASACSAALAAQGDFFDACYVRLEPAPPAAGAKTEPAAGTSHLGLRRKSTRLFEVELLVAAADGSTCAVNGVAKLRSVAGQEALAMVVRPDTGLPQRGHAAVPCQLIVRATSAAMEIGTTQASCPAELLCGGRIALQGQRFDVAGRIPHGASGPCFARTAP